MRPTPKPTRTTPPAPPIRPRTPGRGNDQVAGRTGDGELPDGTRVIEAPTPWVWLIGRTQTNGPGDDAAVNAVQESYAITPLQEKGHLIDPTEVTTTEPCSWSTGG
jgi:hypothetical protein